MLQKPIVNCPDVNRYEIEIIVIEWLGLEGDLEAHLVPASCHGRYNLLYETIILFDYKVKNLFPVTLLLDRVCKEKDSSSILWFWWDLIFSLRNWKIM